MRLKVHMYEQYRSNDRWKQIMERVHVCLRKEKTITTRRVETMSIRWE